MNSHQRRIGYKNCEEGLLKLLPKEFEFDNATKYRDLMRITDSIAQNTNRLGALWSYDTSLRIGFYLNIYPEAVYIQSGVRDGVRKMHANLKRIPRTMSASQFPRLKELEPYEMENFLCVWGKDNLQKSLC